MLASPLQIDADLVPDPAHHFDAVERIRVRIRMRTLILFFI
jgi:hypothetical protein